MSQPPSNEIDTVAAKAETTSSVKPAITKEPTQVTLIEVTDKKLVVLAILMKIPWVRKTKSYKTMFYFDKERWKEVLRRWQSPEPNMYDIKEFFNAEDVFNSAIHDDA